MINPAGYINPVAYTRDRVERAGYPVAAAWVQDGEVVVRVDDALIVHTRTVNPYDAARAAVWCIRLADRADLEARAAHHIDLRLDA